MHPPISGRFPKPVRVLWVFLALAFVPCPQAVRGATLEVPALVKEYCFDCHGEGSKKGGVSLDLESGGAEETRNKWFAVWKNLEAELMPPSDKARPTLEQRAQILRWVEATALGLDEKHPDPGKVTIRRLNREEYRNTIRDLTGVEYAVEEKFPADDTGYGFDTIGAVLSLSPIHMEKYLAAAQEIVASAFRLNNSLAGVGIPYGPPPADAVQRRAYMRGLLKGFAARAFRRPVDAETLEKLTVLALEEDRFEDGFQRGLSAVLAAPRFLFRAEVEAEGADAGGIAPVDEYALASRLSYFLWSSLPDVELMRLAEKGELRKELGAQVERMLKDSRSGRFVRNFVGQWLQTRDTTGVPVQPRVILGIKKGDPEDKFFSKAVREGMKRETEALFQHVLRQNLPAEELLTARYSFVNEALAGFYGIKGVKGSEPQKVELGEGLHRRGILGHGSFLVVTSNPTRTSPVKRGLFILENILGAPAPPPPPNIPPLESAQRGKRMSMRELMALHRADALCASCHQRMDPLGLAFENFNALGMRRDSTDADPLDVSGQLITGEKFTDFEGLVEILSTSRRRDFYRCLAEKLLTYSLGRGMEASDIPNIHKVLERVEAGQGRLGEFVLAVVESVPFQNVRRAGGRGGVTE